MVNVYSVILTRPITFAQAETMGMVCLCCLPIPHADITAYLAVVATRYYPGNPDQTNDLWRDMRNYGIFSTQFLTYTDERIYNYGI